LTVVAAIRQHNFCVMARKLRKAENDFRILCSFNELRVVKIPHISTSTLYISRRPLDHIGWPIFKTANSCPAEIGFHAQVTLRDIVAATAIASRRLFLCEAAHHDADLVLYITGKRSMIDDSVLRICRVGPLLGLITRDNLYRAMRIPPPQRSTARGVSFTGAKRTSRVYLVTLF
jgi:hypothetical protein